MNVLRPLALVGLVTLVACDAVPEDSKSIRARYQGHYAGQCFAWVKSHVSGRAYCSSPALPWSTAAAYEAAITKVDDAAFAGFDGKTPDEKLAVLMAEGKSGYANNCASCHGAEATGNGELYPPLANDPVANGGSVDEHVTTVLKGLSGKTINGVAYTGAMTPFGHLTDNQIAAIITFERNSWGNAGGVVEPAQVTALRGK